MSVVNARELIEVHEDIVEVHRRLAALKDQPASPEREYLLHMLEILEARKRDLRRSPAA